MQYNINKFIGFKMGARDGDVGEIKEFYFDDETWAIRYLIVETGNWFSNKKVLIAPQALLAPDFSNKILPINLTKAQIKSSPDIDTDKPISRRQEVEMFGHYVWERYGGSGFYAGGSAAVMNLPPIVDEEIIKENDPNENAEDGDPHLRSSERVTGYYIHATDGDIGHIKDFIVNNKTWIITDLVIDTHNWLGGKRILMPVRHVKDIQWDNFKIILDVSKKYLEDCTIFNEPSFVFPQNLFEL